MSQNINPSSSLPPLSTGNVVSAGIRLYRSHFKQYLGLAFKALLWWFIPVYGWAKSAAILAAICRHAFSELIDKPESTSTSCEQLKPRLWEFWVTGILVGLINFGINLGISLAAGIILIIPVILLKVIVKDSAITTSLTSLLQIFIRLITFAIQIWFQARFFVSELPLAMETNMDSTTTITRSWQLTKGYAIKIQTILFVAYLITAPLLIVAFLPLFFMIPVLAANPSQDTIISVVAISVLVMAILIIIFSVLMIPFWQTIKAVIYYDLRSRKEGLGLQLRDRSI
jgi:hypothetical protein